MRSASTLLAVQLLSVWAPVVARAQSDPPVSTAARQAAEAMVARFADSWNHADASAYGANYWPEAELVNPSGVITHSQRAIVQEHVGLWAGIFEGSHITAKVRRIRMLGANFMMVDFDAELAGVRRLPPGSPADAAGVLHNHLKHVMERRHGVWKVLAAQNTFIAQP